VESCREEGLKFGFYFSLEEWDYPLINDEGILINRNWIDRPPRLEPYSKILEKKCSGKIAVKNYAEDYLIPQAAEFMDKYDPDILWYDGEWETPVHVTRSYDIAAYFYNHAEGRKEVAVNDRYGLGSDGEKLRFRRGDIFTSEFHDNEDADRTHAWEENRGISQSYGFNWQDTEENVISAEEFVTMFVDIVSRGGNLLLIVNLDGQGVLPDVQEKRLKEIGKWLKVNAEGIYGTRRFSPTSEGNVRYTRSKDKKNVFAITTEWPGEKLLLKSVFPKEGTDIHLLGIEEPCEWLYDGTDGSVTISIPDNLQNELNRPCKYAYTFKIETGGENN
jgi:alpha-L-fucosidase